MRVCGLALGLSLACVASAYSSYDHSCTWFHDAPIWHRLRRAADDYLAGRAQWPASRGVGTISSEASSRCPLGAHTNRLLDMAAAAGAAELGPAVFDVYSQISFVDVALSGWPAFALLHRLCSRRLAGRDRCASWPAAAEFLSRPGAGAVFADVVKPALAAQAALLRPRQGNESAATAVASLELVAQFLRAAQDRWAAQGEDPVTWFALSHEEPCCQLWAELARAQALLRASTELRCASGHRRADGAVCPACRLAAQAAWIEEAAAGDRGLEALPALPHELGPPAPAAHRRPNFVLATVLTSEDAELAGAEHSEAKAVLLTYVDAARTLAFSAQRFHLGPLLVMVSGPPPPALLALQGSGLVRVRELPAAPHGLRPSLWAKLHLWRLDFDIVLYLDADTLIVGDLGELLRAAAASPALAFAAALARSMGALNTGVMLLRPGQEMFERMLASYRASWRWQGSSRWSGQPWNASSAAGPSGADVAGSWRDDLADQDWRNEFFAQHFEYLGEVALGSAALCDAGRPWLASYLAALRQPAASGGPAAEGGPAYCTLPMAYNFCATSPCVARLASGPESHRAALAGAGAGPAPAGHPAAWARVLHWPGPLRKPWQRCLPAARSALDDVWWRVFAASCEAAPADAACSITC